MEICHGILTAFSARLNLVKKLSDLQQVMEARVLAVKHIQTQLSRCYVKIKHKNNIIYSAPSQKVAGL